MKKALLALRKNTWTGVRAMLVFTVLLGVVYPLVMTGIGQLFFPRQSNGSLLRGTDGAVVGSSLIGQSFSDAHGNPLPQYFQPRLSTHDYDGKASGGSNLGPENLDLITRIKQLKTDIAAFDGVSEAEVPPDAVTESASGLDPDISPAYAAIQVSRVAAARGLSPDQVRILVLANTRGRDLGFMGEPRVNVVTLNLALDQLTA